MTLPYSVSADLLPVSASPTFSMRILPFAATLVNGTFATAFAVIVALLTSAEMIYGLDVYKRQEPSGTVADFDHALDAVLCGDRQFHLVHDGVDVYKRQDMEK